MNPTLPVVTVCTTVAALVVFLAGTGLTFLTEFEAFE